MKRFFVFLMVLFCLPLFGQSHSNQSTPRWRYAWSYDKFVVRESGSSENYWRYLQYGTADSMLFSKNFTLYPENALFVAIDDTTSGDDSLMVTIDLLVSFADTASGTNRIKAQTLHFRHPDSTTTFDTLKVAGTYTAVVDTTLWPLFNGVYRAYCHSGNRTKAGVRLRLDHLGVARKEE